MEALLVLRRPCHRFERPQWDGNLEGYRLATLEPNCPRNFLRLADSNNTASLHLVILFISMIRIVSLVLSSLCFCLNILKWIFFQRKSKEILWIFVVLSTLDWFRIYFLTFFTYPIFFHNIIFISYHFVLLNLNVIRCYITTVSVLVLVFLCKQILGSELKTWSIYFILRNYKNRLYLFYLIYIFEKLFFCSDGTSGPRRTSPACAKTRPKRPPRPKRSRREPCWQSRRPERGCSEQKREPELKENVHKFRKSSKLKVRSHENRINFY